MGNKGDKPKKRTLFDRFLDINEDDRKILFGFTKESDLRKTLNEKKLTMDYLHKTVEWFENEYMSPFWTGDIIQDTNQKNWIVTCIYTDNSIDLISAEGEIRRKNTGTLTTEYIKIGKLEKIYEEEV